MRFVRVKDPPLILQIRISNIEIPAFAGAASRTQAKQIPTVKMPNDKVQISNETQSSNVKMSWF
jgi:hypothetical protein